MSLVGLGVSGGIGAYKAVEVARLLQKRGHEVQAVMTRSARKFVGPLTFEALLPALHTAEPAASRCDARPWAAGEASSGGFNKLSDLVYLIESARPNETRPRSAARTMAPASRWLLGAANAAFC